MMGGTSWLVNLLWGRRNLTSFSLFYFLIMHFIL